MHEARAAQEVGDAQAAKETARATRWQDVTGASREISQSRRRVIPYHDRPCRRDSLDQLLQRRLFHDQLQMLRRDIISDLGGLIQIFYHDGQKTLIEQRSCAPVATYGLLAISHGFSRVNGLPCSMRAIYQRAAR